MASKFDLIVAIEQEQSRLHEYQIWPPLDALKKPELVERLAELKARA